MRQVVSRAACGGLALLSAAVCGVRAEPASVLQALIDGARPGDAVRLPEGRYEGPVLLKEGVAVVGAEGGRTVIDGAGCAAAVAGAPDSVLSGVTVAGGRVGIDADRVFMGVFDCTIVGDKNIGIHVGGGGSVIVNDLVVGGTIRCNSSCPTIICTTVVSNCEDGIWSWYAPGPKVIDSLVVGATFGIRAGAGASPSLRGIAVWDNAKDFEGCRADGPVAADPRFADPARGDYRLAPSSPLVAAGSPVAGLWNGERPDIGWNASRRCGIAECRALMKAVAGELARNGDAVTYTLGGEPGVFLVTVERRRGEFTIRSSTDRTAIGDIDAYDETGVEELEAELVAGARPAVSVRKASAAAPQGRGARAVPVEGALTNSLGARYVLESVYRSPESYFDSGGMRIFRRTTNLSRAIVEIPDGYAPVHVLLNGSPVEVSGAIEFAFPGEKEIEIGLRKE